MANGQLDVVVRHIRQLVGGRGEGLQDGQLLQRFAAGEESAFTALVRRHGPMVLGVCRRILGNVHEAEDAFQATFLVLLRRAHALDRRGSLAGWLYTVAYHVALRARARAARRQRQERKVAQMADTVAPAAELWHDLQPLLDDELGRLPDNQREAVLLCCVQGKSHAEAARLLGWPVGTVKGRLARARETLRKRLVRRGISLSAGALTVVLAEKVSAAVPATLVHATVRTALATAGGAASVPALSLAEGVLKAMFVTKLKIATALLFVAGLVALSAGAVANSAMPPAEIKGSAPPPPPTAKHQAQVKPVAAPQPAKAKEAAKERLLTGRVLGSNGKPLAGARVAVLGWSDWGRLPRWNRPGMMMLGGKQTGRFIAAPNRRPLPVPELVGQAVTDRAGKFRVKINQAVGGAQVVLAGAAGHGIGWSAIGKDNSLEIRLPAEQVIRGRLVDVQGQPAANVKVEVSRVGSRPTGQGSVRLLLDTAAEAGLDYDMDQDGDLLLWMATVQQNIMMFPTDGKTIHDHVIYKSGGDAVVALVSRTPPPASLSFWPKSVTTDAQGRFTIHGIGRGQGIGLLVQDERYAIQALDLPAEKTSKGKEIPLVLQPPRTLEGTMLDVASGRPVPGARLRVQPPRGSGFLVFQVAGGAGADWRGRHGRVGFGLSQEVAFVLANRISGGGVSELPAIEVKADAKGHFKLPLYHSGSYTVQLTGPAGEHYLPRSVGIQWPRGGVVRKEMNLTLVRGVPVHGKVTEDSGKAVAGARVDFWSKGLKLLDGVPFPRAVKTGKDGTFEALLPPASWHLVVNAAKADYIFHKIEADKLVKTGKAPARTEYQKQGNVFVPVQVEKQHDPSEFFYPDGWMALDVKASAPLIGVEVFLRRAPVFRGRLIGPDGKAVTTPVHIVSAGPHVLDRDGKDGTFAIPANDPQAEYRLYFLVPARNLGAVIKLKGKQAGGPARMIKLAPLGAARVRFRDAAGKPLANYRPVVWLLTSPKGTAESKQLVQADQNVPLALFLNRLDAGHHYVTGSKTDAEGRVTLTNLIPGATYRIILNDRRVHDFTVQAGQTVTLPDLTIDRAKK
jgi:RNA polymerase sigma factor (sigma-70 family)